MAQPNQPHDSGPLHDPIGAEQGAENDADLTEQKLTDDELWVAYESLPPGTRADIIGDRIIMQSAPFNRHQWVNQRLYFALALVFGTDITPKEPEEDWWILHTPGVRYREKKEITPDMAGWRKSKLPRLVLDEPQHVIPDWICEILSQGTRKFDLNEKRNLYCELGVEWLWFIDPKRRTIDVQCLVADPLDGKRYKTMAHAVSTGPLILPPFNMSINFGRLWLPG